MMTDITIKEVNKYEEEVLRLIREWYAKGVDGADYLRLWEAVGQMCEHENLAKYQEGKKK